MLNVTGDDQKVNVALVNNQPDAWSGLNRQPNGNRVQEHQSRGQGIMPEKANQLIPTTCQDQKIPVLLDLLAGKEPPYAAVRPTLAITKK